MSCGVKEETFGSWLGTLLGVLVWYTVTYTVRYTVRCVGVVVYTVRYTVRYTFSSVNWLVCKLFCGEKGENYTCKNSFRKKLLLMCLKMIN